MKNTSFLHKTTIGIVTLSLLISACGDKSMNKSEVTIQSKHIPEKVWNKLSAKKIYFGHMSVGYNIIDGINDLMKSNPAIKLNIQDTTDLSNFKNGVFAHSQNGENVKPKTKVDAFVKTMDSGLAKQVDIAFFKFCYVDINKDTDVKELFKYYTSAMSKLKKKYPNVTFLHMTVPITTEGEMVNIKTQLKEIIKKIIGRETNKQQDISSNIKRNEFNDLIKSEYDPKIIIDLEQFESTNNDGSPYWSNNGGVKHKSMVPAYTFDGGHLNETGRIAIADKFLTQLAGI